MYQVGDYVRIATQSDFTEEVGQGWPSRILITGSSLIALGYCTIKSFISLCYDWTRLWILIWIVGPLSVKSKRIEIWKYISDDPRYFNTQKSTISYLGWWWSHDLHVTHGVACLAYGSQDLEPTCMSPSAIEPATIYRFCVAILLSSDTCINTLSCEQVHLW